MLKCFDFLCRDCGNKTECYVRTDSPDWDMGEACGFCGSVNTYKVMSAPEIRTDDNAASFVDGTKRKGLQDMKKVAKLEVERSMLDYRDPRRAEISKEIKERKKL